MVGSLPDVKPKGTQLLWCIPHVQINRECFIHILFIVTEMLLKGRENPWQMFRLESPSGLNMVSWDIIVIWKGMNKPSLVNYVSIHSYKHASIQVTADMFFLNKKKKAEGEERLLHHNTASHLLQSSFAPSHVPPFFSRYHPSLVHSQLEHCTVPLHFSQSPPKLLQPDQNFPSF